MTAATGPKKAVQYVRMSTDHQQYSTLNQKTAIAALSVVRVFGTIERLN
jgi:DNA invertase Pin-like site-specific DNA recombinase